MAMMLEIGLAIPTLAQEHEYRRSRSSQTTGAAKTAYDGRVTALNDRYKGESSFR